MNSKEAILPEVKEFMNSGSEMDFLDPNVQHDSVIVVEGKKFYVNSGFLSVWSKYFNGWYREVEQGFALTDLFPVMHMEAVKAEEFEDFLRFIYPAVQIINEYDLPNLVNLAFLFQSPAALEICKDFVYKNFDDLDKIQLLDLASHFEMDDIKDHTLAIINSALSSYDLLGLLKVAFNHNLEKLKKDIGTVIFANVAKPAPNAVLFGCSQCLNGLKGPECIHEEKEELLFNPFNYENMEKILKLPEEIKDFILYSTFRK